MTGSEPTRAVHHESSAFRSRQRSSARRIVFGLRAIGSLALRAPSGNGRTDPPLRSPVLHAHSAIPRYRLMRPTPFRCSPENEPSLPPHASTRYPPLDFGTPLERTSLPRIQLVVRDCTRLREIAVQLRGSRSTSQPRPGKPESPAGSVPAILLCKASSSSLRCSSGIASGQSKVRIFASSIRSEGWACRTLAIAIAPYFMKCY